MAICFGDRTYCSSKHCKGDCGRKMSPEEEKRAKESHLPVAYGDFCSELAKVEQLFRYCFE